MTFSDVSVLLYEYQAQYRALINVVVIYYLFGFSFRLTCCNICSGPQLYSATVQPACVTASSVVYCVNICRISVVYYMASHPCVHVVACDCECMRYTMLLLTLWTVALWSLRFSRMSL